MLEHQEKLGKRSWTWFWRHKVRIGIVVGLLLALNTSGFQNFYNAFTWDPLTDFVKKSVMQDQSREVQKLYKNNLIQELERNIRVLQLNVWYLKEKWKNLVDFQTSMLQTYMLFNYDQDIYLKDFSEINLMSEVTRIYERFKRAEQQIDQIRIGRQPPLSDRERKALIEQHTKDVDDAIQIHKKLYASLPEKSYPSKPHLKLDWEEHLSEIGLDFTSVITSHSSAEEVEYRP